MAAGRKAKFKKQTIGGQDQFSDAHGALRQAPQDQANGLTRLSDDLDGYFYALAMAATTEKGVLEELVKANTALTNTNSELSASVAILVKDDEQLSRCVCNRRNNRTRKDSPAPCSKTLFPHCKIKVMHAPDNCFKLKKNSTIHPRGWKRCLWRWGSSKIVDNNFNELSNYHLSPFLLSNRYSPPHFDPIPYQIKTIQQNAVINSRIRRQWLLIHPGCA